MVSECGVVDLVKQYPDEGNGFFIGIALKLGVDLNYESGGDRREQTGLIISSARVHQDFIRNSRISGSWLDLHRVSSGSPCRILRPPFGSQYRIQLDDPLERTVRLVSGCKI